jgi:hypothetical protein
MGGGCLVIERLAVMLNQASTEPKRRRNAVGRIRTVARHLARELTAFGGDLAEGQSGLES